MKRLAVVAVVAVIATALVSCSGTDAAVPVDDPPDPTAEVAADPDDDVPTLMAAALEQLVTVDNTFGGGPPPFTEYLIQSHLAADAGSPTAGDAGRALTTAERDAIEGVIRPLGAVRWIEDPDEWRTDDLQPTIDGAVILGVGEPTIDGASALVPVSLWCGGLCGTWLTYRLDGADDGWQVTGTDGPIAIA